MKILALIQCTNLGGMEQSTVLLLDELRNLGHEVELLSLNKMGPLENVLQQHQVPFSAIGYSGKWGWRSFLNLRNTLRHKQADALVMVGHNLMAMLALGNFCKHRRVLSLHFHHQGVKPNWAWKLVYAVAIRRFKYILYPSLFIMNEALNIAPSLSAAKRTISYPIPNPILLPEKVKADESLKARRGYGLSKNEKVVGNAGWLITRKRWDVFLKVASIVARGVPEVRFLIAGDGPEKTNLQRLAAELKIADRVLWLGWQEDLTNFYRALDVMLFNSEWDAMGRTPLEAMSYGVPVVASVINGGLKEVLDHNDYGFLFSTHDIEAMSGRVIQLLRDSKLHSALAENSRARIEQVGSPKMHAMRVLSLLEGNQMPLGSQTGSN